MRKMARIIVALAAPLLLISGTATPSAAAPTVTKRCTGDRAWRCAWINFDGDRIRAYGSVQDTTAGTVTVWARVVLYELGPGETPVANSGPMRSASEYIQVNTPTYDCQGSHSYRAVTYFKWGSAPVDYIESDIWLNPFC